MVVSRGFVDTVAVSGNIWSSHEALDAKTLIFESLRKAKTSIQISIFSLGKRNTETEEFFQIIEDKLKSKRTVQFLVNDVNGKLVGKFARSRLNDLTKYPNFDLQNFVSKNNVSLHAKIIVIDRKFVLVGSANLSYHGMFSNYEIILKVTGNAVADIANLIDKLAVGIKSGEKL